MRTRSRRRLVSSREYERKDEESMRKEVENLAKLYPKDLGYVLEIVTPE